MVPIRGLLWGLNENRLIATIPAIVVLNKCQLLVVVFVIAIINFTIKSITENMNSVPIRLLKCLL